MDEEETNKEDKATETAKTENDGDKYETTPVIERARQEREKLEAIHSKIKEENDRTERIMARQALGGMSEAGQEAVKPKEETPKEYMDKIMKNE